MPADLSASLYWTSLGLSAAAVVAFLWLIRERKPRVERPSHRAGEISKTAPPPPASREREGAEP